MRSVVRVARRVEETPSTVTLRFRYPPAASPGQFVMVWLPGDDELPMSLSYTDGEEKGVTIKAMGESSRRCLAVPVGAEIGIRGPYGNRFDTSVPNVLIVAGGSGAAVVAPAAEELRRRGGSATVALGATTSLELLFAGRFAEVGATVALATDDGSRGERGYVTAVAERLLAKERFDAVWTCGPEVMMRKVVALASSRSVPVFCSVERHMKCALGMCDACALGSYHVCTDGPVFPGGALTATEEFGRFHRDPSGRRHAF